VTKIFTITTLLSLLSARTIEFNMPLVDVLPEFGKGGPRPVDGGQDPHTGVYLPMPQALREKLVDPKQVTLRHLLTHTSGLSPWRDVYTMAGPVPAPLDQPEPVARDVRWGRAIEALCQYPFVDAPGDVVRYSDVGLLLLGEVVRRLAGRELDEAIRVQVLEPLGLKSPVFNPVRNGRDRNRIVPTEHDSRWRMRRVWGEVHDENACGVGGVAGHAGLFAAVRDVAALGQAWLDDDDRLAIPTAIMREATREQAVTGDMRRGLGWQMKTLVDANAGDLMSADTYGHTGYVGNSLWIDPPRSLVVATMTNAVYYGRAFEGMYEFRRAIHDAVVWATDG
jgi:CubicO group peptidase (beta-lactamase class C family)